MDKKVQGEDYIIKETSVWGDYYKGRSSPNFIRLLKKAKLLQKYTYPFLDHGTKYAYKPKNQKGSAKESQTFIVAYPYNYDEFIGDKENEFMKDLIATGLRFHKEKCIFREKDAHRIIIMDNDVNLGSVLKFCESSQK